ncbi:MAG TPA: ABC transporter substrate-binding protein [Burkholderiaceae bacterium]|jgi:ABC-type branched-subunit amino acid transport system substrate-binding protein
MIKMTTQAVAISAVALFTMQIAQAKDIVVGQSTALTGVLASSGVPMRLGAQVYFDMVNAAGGVNGNHIRFISLDDAYKVDQTIKNVNALIDKDVVALVGGTGTSNNEALLREKILANANLAVVGPRTGASSLRVPYTPYFFHLRVSYAQEVNKAIEHYVSIGFKKIGIVYQDDAFGTDALAAAKFALKQAGIEPAFLSTYERNTTKVEASVKIALAAQTQAILLLTTGGPTAAFVKLFREAGGSSQLMALSINDPNSIIQSIGIKNAHGLSITTVFPSPTRYDYPVIKEYQTTLKKFGPAEAQPTLASLEGYLAAKVLVEGLKKAGANPTREKVLQALEGLSNKDLGGFRVNFGPNIRAGSNYVDISIISKNGAVLR